MLRLTAALERDLRAGLAMAERNGPPSLSVWARRFHVVLEQQRIPRAATSILQLTLWSTVRTGRPERWLGRIPCDFTFHCVAENCTNISARECVRRQLTSEIQRTKDTERGQASRYPLCKTGTCEQGTAIRYSLEQQVSWIGKGPGNRFGNRRRRDGSDNHFRVG